MAREHSEAATTWHGAAGAPVVVLLHDWHGRLPWIDGFGVRLAGHGFRVAVPDFYDGATATDASASRRLLRRRTSDMMGAHRILRGAIAEARAGGSARVALVGFSMGAMIALEYAAQSPVDAVVAYYGAARVGEGTVRVPVLFQLAERDTWRGKEPPTALQARLSAEGHHTVELRTYAGAEHGFQNEQVARKFDADASAAAWASTLGFLRAHLAPVE